MPIPAASLAALLAGAGVLHLVAPGFFDAMVPTELPGGARPWTYASGVAELGVAAAIAVPRTRRRGALAAAALFVAVFPANVKMAIDWSDRSTVEQLIAYGRVPLQVPLVLWALKVRRDAASPRWSTPTSRPCCHGRRGGPQRALERPGHQPRLPIMPRYAVLLRGINVGTAKRVPMADLRELLGGLGYTEVRTILNSGNAVVTGPEAEAHDQATAVEGALQERFGFGVRVIVLTAEAVRAIADGHPFADVADNGSRMMVHVLAAAPGPDLLDGYDPVAADPDRARLVDRVIYQWCPDGLLAAPGVGWPDVRSVLVTTRNWNTIMKLRALL